MSGADRALAVLVSVVWGLAFPISKIGLESFSPAELAALRFLIACLAVLFLKRPALPWSALLLIGLTLFAGQFLLFFAALAAGLPPGLGSVTQQAQAFLTVLLAAIFLGERPGRLQALGLVIAAAGLAAIATTIGGDLPALGLVLALAGALSWAIGNLLVKRLPAVPVLPLMAWCALVPPLPALLVDAAVERRWPLVGSLPAASGASLLAALYLGAVATVLAYALWGGLLQRHPAGRVAPYALVAPCVGVLSSALIFGEVFPPARYAGMALILAGVAIAVLPVQGARRYFTRA